jgi:hypothetical protein
MYIYNSHVSFISYDLEYHLVLISPGIQVWMATIDGKSGFKFH